MKKIKMNKKEIKLDQEIVDGIDNIISTDKVEVNEKKKSKFSLPFVITINRIYIFIAITIISVSLLYYFNKEEIFETMLENHINMINDDLKKQKSPFSLSFKTIDIDLKKDDITLKELNILKNKLSFIKVGSIYGQKIEDEKLKTTTINFLIENFEISNSIEEKIKLYFYENENLIKKEQLNIFIEKFKSLILSTKIENNFINKKNNNGVLLDSINKIKINNNYFSLEINFFVEKLDLNNLKELYINDFNIIFENKDLKTLFSNSTEEENIVFFKLLKISLQEELLLEYPNIEKIVFFDKMFDDTNSFNFNIKKDKPFNILNVIDLIFNQEIKKIEE